MNKLYLLLFLFYFPCRHSAHRCQSCFAGCENFDDCDCEGDERTNCDAPYCYAKLEYFTDDGVSGIQKGCTNRVSSSFIGCQYASDDRSIACFCSGPSCNSARNLSLYAAPRLPLVTCCECNEDETGDEECDLANCTRNCTGNYCYLDMVANAQGCGWGHPQLFHFLRTEKYRRWSNELTCAEYYDSNRNYMSGCTCSKDFCNVARNVTTLKARQKKLVEEQGSHFCYSLYAHSEEPFTKDIYRRASLCQSHYCFVSWTSVEVVFDSDDEDDSIGDTGSGEGPYWTGKRRYTDYNNPIALPSLRSTYEISAGCLLVDDGRKVQPGCTTEWSQTENRPLTKHCICSDKLCNDFYVIENSNWTPPESPVPEGNEEGPTDPPPPTAVTEERRPPLPTEVKEERRPQPEAKEDRPPPEAKEMGPPSEATEGKGAPPEVKEERRPQPGDKEDRPPPEAKGMGPPLEATEGKGSQTEVKEDRPMPEVQEGRGPIPEVIEGKGPSPEAKEGRDPPPEVKEGRPPPEVKEDNKAKVPAEDKTLPLPKVSKERRPPPKVPEDVAPPSPEVIEDWEAPVGKDALAPIEETTTVVTTSPTTTTTTTTSTTSTVMQTTSQGTTGPANEWDKFGKEPTPVTSAFTVSPTTEPIIAEGPGSPDFGPTDSEDNWLVTSSIRPNSTGNYRIRDGERSATNPCRKISLTLRLLLTLCTVISVICTAA